VDENPYKSPQGNDDPPRSTRNIFGRRRKPLWGYPLAAVVGAFVGAAVLMPSTAVLDDAGGTQMLIGGFLGLVIYGLLF
jgi:hypothetical protein